MSKLFLVMHFSSIVQNNATLYKPVRASRNKHLQPNS